MGKKRVAEKETPAVESKRQKITKNDDGKKSVEPVVHAEKTHTKQKKKVQKTSTLDFFSGSFYAKLDDFQSLYKDFLDVKVSSTDGNAETEMQDITNKVRESIQDEAAKIFKSQLEDIETWINSEIGKINEEIKSIEEVYEQNRESLLKTGAFTEEEVKKQLSPIQAKVATKKETREKYQELLTRSKQIYA